MPRPHRIQAAGLTYHVTARGVRRSSIYVDDADRRRFLVILANVVEHYALRCHAYCQMTNHYHLAVTTREANLSRALHELNGSYAQWWNWRHQRDGHLFGSRFGAQIVQDETYLANVCRYIVFNPVRAGIVKAPDQWRWSSYRAMIGVARQPRFLDCARLGEVTAPDDPNDGVIRFRQLLLTTSADALQLPRRSILGDDAFVARFTPSHAKARREMAGSDGRRDLESIFQGATTRPLRNAGIVIALEKRFTRTEIAQHLELHPDTVRKIVTAESAGP